MKVVHVLKRIETIDNDIKDLKKLEKSISREKSFSTPIYMSIEQQINILLAERVKLFELQVSNPPDTLVQQIEGEEEDDSFKPLLPSKTAKKSTKKSKKKTVSKKTVEQKPQLDEEEEDEDDDLPFRMLTQDQIDNRISDMEAQKDEPAKKEQPVEEKAPESEEEKTDEGIKLLDIALDKDSSKRKSATKEKKRVRFFKDNFPGGEY